MRTTELMGHHVHHSATIFGKVYFFAYDIEGTCYMLKVNADGTLDIL